jgi:hypothetical protein
VGTYSQPTLFINNTRDIQIETLRIQRRLQNELYIALFEEEADAGGIPNFDWIVYNPERFYHRDGKHYKILPGGYLFGISDQITLST